MIYIAAHDIANVQAKFYHNSNCFNNFEDVDLRDINVIKIFADHYKNVEAPKYLNKGSLFPKLDYYYQTLKFIFTAFNKSIAESFDIQVLFLIFAVDPDLNMYKDTLRHMPTIDKPLSYFIKDNNGIYDVKLIEYEKIFYDRFLADKKLLVDIGDVGRKHAKLLLKTVPNIESFTSVSDDDFQRLQHNAEKWFLEVGQNDYKIAAFNIARQSEFLEIKNIYEQLIFFVLTVDPEMNMLKIYEEESKIDDIKGRAIEEFGFYNEYFISLELLYKKRFFPDKKLSEWTFI